MNVALSEVFVFLHQLIEQEKLNESAFTSMSRVYAPRNAPRTLAFANMFVDEAWWRESCASKPGMTDPYTLV